MARRDTSRIRSSPTTRCIASRRRWPSSPPRSWDAGQRILSAHGLPGLEHRRRHRRAERDPRRAQAAFQPAFLHRADRRDAAARRDRDPRPARPRLHARVVRLGTAVPHRARRTHGSGAARRARGDGATPAASTTGGTSDGRFIAPTGAQVVELGVVNATIHKVNEHVDVADIDVLVRIYERVMELCRSPTPAG